MTPFSRKRKRSGKDDSVLAYLKESHAAFAKQQYQILMKLEKSHQSFKRMFMQLLQKGAEGKGDEINKKGNGQGALY